MGLPIPHGEGKGLDAAFASPLQHEELGVVSMCAVRLARDSIARRATRSHRV